MPSPEMVQGLHDAPWAVLGGWEDAVVPAQPPRVGWEKKKGGRRDKMASQMAVRGQGFDGMHDP